MPSAAREPAVSVLIRTRDGGERLRRAVHSILSEPAPEVEIVLLDSGSHDGVSASLAGGPVRLVEFPAPFTHPGSSNAAAREARGPILLFLSQDATPRGTGWLEALLAPFAGPGVAATFARQAPPEDTPVLEARDVLRAYPERGPSPTVLSNVCSALRTALWREHPFDERLPLAEDLEWGLWALGRGHRIAYVPEAVVEHAHGYDPDALERRYRMEGRALAILGRHPLDGGGPGRLWLRGLAGDLWAVLRSRRWSQLPGAGEYHRVMYRAMLDGYREQLAAAGPS